MSLAPAALSICCTFSAEGLGAAGADGAAAEASFAGPDAVAVEPTGADLRIVALLGRHSCCELWRCLCSLGRGLGLFNEGNELLAEVRRSTSAAGTIARRLNRSTLSKCKSWYQNQRGDHHRLQSLHVDVLGSAGNSADAFTRADHRKLIAR
ncbi:hypothetical protein EMGR_008154 [Emarellia grisea]